MALIASRTPPLGGVPFSPLREKVAFGVSRRSDEGASAIGRRSLLETHTDPVSRHSPSLAPRRGEGHPLPPGGEGGRSLSLTLMLRRRRRRPRSTRVTHGARHPILRGSLSLAPQHEVGNGDRSPPKPFSRLVFAGNPSPLLQPGLFSSRRPSRRVRVATGASREGWAAPRREPPEACGPAPPGRVRPDATTSDPPVVSRLQAPGTVPCRTDVRRGPPGGRADEAGGEDAARGARRAPHN